jgi:hypothetical protein
VIGRADPMRPAVARPGHATNRSHFQRPPLIKTDYRRARRAPAVERADTVFF